jgi:hypothetical protein
VIGEVMSFALALIVASSCVAAAAAQESLSYTPPPEPVAPDPASLLLRLVMVTAGALAICIGILWLIRRTQRGAVGAGNPTGRIHHDGTLTLDRRSALHVLRVDGQTVAVTTDITGLRSITLLSEPFDMHLAET